MSVKSFSWFSSSFDSSHAIARSMLFSPPSVFTPLLNIAIWLLGLLSMVTPDRDAVTLAKFSFTPANFPVGALESVNVFLLLWLLITPGNESVIPESSHSLVLFSTFDAKFKTSCGGATFLVSLTADGLVEESLVLFNFGFTTILLLFACFLAADTSPGSPVDLHLRCHFVSSLECWAGS